MATVATEIQDREVSIGRIFSRAFGAFAAHPIMMLSLAFVFGALPNMIVFAAYLHWAFHFSLGVMFVAVFALFGVNMVPATLVQGTSALAIVASGEGRSADIADTLPPALLHLISLILLGVVIGVGFALGLVLLIVPGIMLYVAWWVAAPALVVERLGVAAALGRSISLTRGARWRVFGIEMLLGVSGWLINAALRAVGLEWEGQVPSGWESRPLASLIVYALVMTVSLALYAAMHTACYVELREWKEGPATDALAEVFR